MANRSCNTTTAKVVATTGSAMVIVVALVEDILARPAP
jgi:hypothetical protein